MGVESAVLRRLWGCIACTSGGARARVCACVCVGHFLSVWFFSASSRAILLLLLRPDEANLHSDNGIAVCLSVLPSNSHVSSMCLGLRTASCSPVLVVDDH